MGTVPVLKPNKIVSTLERLGFLEIRQKGSHKQFRHPDGRRTTVPFHAGSYMYNIKFLIKSALRLGEVAERLKAPLSKSGILSKTGSWVRIPPSPPA